MVSQLPSGRWQARVWVDGRKVAVSQVLDDRELEELGAVRGTFASDKLAGRAESMAEIKAAKGLRSNITVREFWERWTSDPLFERPKKSTNVHNKERTSGFVARFGDVPIRKVTDDHVGDWLRGGRRNGTVPALNAMFNDAGSSKAGRLVSANPFSGLGLRKGPGNRFKHPPEPGMVEALIVAACGVLPSFGDWLAVAAATGMRPGELDALRWRNVDFEARRVHVVEQWSPKATRFELPKNGKKRQALMTPKAGVVLARLHACARGEFVFEPPHAAHFTGANRQHYWKQARRVAGYDGTLYLATRHFAGWYMVNELRLESEDVAIVLGHEDGGTLVRLLYGHRNRELAMDRALAAFEGAGERRLRVVGE